MDESRLPDLPGTYVLCLHLPVQTRLSVGRLGDHLFPEGRFLYVGSAQGPGGLQARIRRHRRPEQKKKRHWHIDWLLPYATWREVWWHQGSPSIECDWARSLADIGRRLPLSFGASDCRCPGHLIYLENKVRERSAWKASERLTLGVLDCLNTIDNHLDLLEENTNDLKN